jgi:hypothetical protein
MLWRDGATQEGAGQGTTTAGDGIQTVERIGQWEKKRRFCAKLGVLARAKGREFRESVRFFVARGRFSG